MRRWDRVDASLITLLATLFGIIVLGSNWRDWDHMLAFLEVDLRAWLQDRRPPTWSYQLCSGVTRIGDPQQFGLSPLFLPVLLFGPLWGSKLLVVGSAAAGLCFVSRTLALVRTRDESAPADWSTTSIAAMLVFGNYFLWRANVGHLTFVTTQWAFGLVWLTLAGWRRPGSWRRFWGATILAWTFYSGPFLPAVAFFLIPIFSCGAVVLCGAFLASAWGDMGAGARRLPKPLFRAASFHLAGLALASYKWIPVLLYARSHERGLPVEQVTEQIQPWKSLWFQMAPTFQGEFIGLRHRELFDIWEYSAFSPIPWILLAFALHRATGAIIGRFTRVDRIHVIVVALVTAGTLLFACGYVGRWSPYGLVNRVIFGGDLRVVGRYQIAVTYCLALLAALVAARFQEAAPRQTRRILAGGLVISVLGAASFLPQLHWPLLRVWAETRRNVEPMRRMILAPPATFDTYRPLRGGLGVVNCYDPLPRPKPLVQALADRRSRPGMILPVVDTSGGRVAPTCVRDSFFTQHRIFLHRSCAAGTCVNVNAVSPEDAESFFFDEPRGLYCLREGAEAG